MKQGNLALGQAPSPSTHRLTRPSIPCPWHLCRLSGEHKSLVSTPNMGSSSSPWFILSSAKPAAVFGLPCHLCHPHFHSHLHHNLRVWKPLHTCGKRSMSSAITFLFGSSIHAGASKNLLEIFSCSQSLIYTHTEVKGWENFPVANIFKLFHHYLQGKAGFGFWET